MPATVTRYRFAFIINYKPHTMQVSEKRQTNLKSEKISAATAQEYLNNYIKLCIKEGEEPSKILKSLRIDRTAIEGILANKKCNYVRMYFGVPSTGAELEGNYTLMLVGVDANNENILGDGEIYDNSVPCPTNCPKKDFEGE